MIFDKENERMFISTNTLIYIFNIKVNIYILLIIFRVHYRL